MAWLSPLVASLLVSAARCTVIQVASEKRCLLASMQKAVADRLLAGTARLLNSHVLQCVLPAVAQSEARPGLVHRRCTAQLVLWYVGSRSQYVCSLPGCLCPAGELVPKAYHGVLHPVLVTAVVANAGLALQGKLLGISYAAAQTAYLAKVSSCPETHCNHRTAWPKIRNICCGTLPTWPFPGTYAQP